MKSDVLMLLVWSKKLLTVIMRIFTTKKPNLMTTTNKFNNRGPSSQSYGFSSGHVCMWELDHKEGWDPKKWCFWTVVLEKTLESPLDCKEIQPVHPKGDRSWVFIGRTDAEAETPILWPPDVKNWLIGKDPMLGKFEGRRRGWQRMRWLDDITDSMDLFEQALGVGDGQGSLACCSPWDRKESDTNEWLNWTDENFYHKDTKFKEFLV